MINLHMIRKTAVLTTWPILGALVFYGGLLTGSLWSALLYLIGFSCLGYFLGKLLLRNSFSDALEGGGLLVVDLASKGVLPTYVLKMDGRNLVNRNNKKVTHFHRSIIQAMRPPIISEGNKWWEFWKLTRAPSVQPASVPTPQKEEVPLEKSIVSRHKDGSFTMNITSEDYQKSRMLIDTIPVIFCNSQTGLFLTKDFLSEFEQKTTILHGLVDLYHKIERLEHQMLTFGRYVVQAAMNEGTGFWRSKAFIVIVVLFVLGVLAYFLGPPVVSAFKQAMGGISLGL